MELKLINYNIGYIEKQSEQSIILGFNNSKKLVEIDEKLLEAKETFLFKINRLDGLLGIVTFKEKEYFIHVKSKNLICTRYI